MAAHETPPLGSGGEWPLMDWLFRPFQALGSPSSDFKGQTILVVFNPQARQGAFQPYAQSLQASLEGMGFRVEFLSTVANPLDRLALIRQKASSLLSDPGVQGLHVFPVGGDGTIDQVVGQVLREIVGPLQQVPPDSKIDQVVREKLAAFTMAQVGTAADIASQVSAPPSWYRVKSFVRKVLFLKPSFPFRDLPDFMANAQRIPLGIAAVTGGVLAEQSVFHSVAFGTSGYLFAQAEANRQGHPKNPLNRGLVSYFRVLPQAIYHYGLLGVEVEIDHHGITDRFRVGELMGTASRIVAASGGIPGAWGEFKLLAIPNGLRGVVMMSESMVRGLGTKLGFNWVGADSVFWTLSSHRQITLRAGEEARIRFFEPQSGLPIEVPWQVNGDSVPTRVREAKIYVPPLSIPVHAAPNSVAMRLYHADQLRQGLTVYNRDESTFSIYRFLPNPTFITFPQGRQLASSPYYPASDLRNLNSDLGIEASRFPLLIARAHGMKRTIKEARFVEAPQAMNDLQAWIRSEEGKRVVQADRALLEDNFSNRFQVRGIGLLFGMASFYGADRLLQGLGVDPEKDRFLHFNLSACMSYGVNQALTGMGSVIVNRIQGIPYDIAMMESRSVNGLLASRFVYESEPNLLKAMGLGALRNLGFGGSLRSILASGAKGLVTVPVRTAWGMGAGYLSSRTSDLIMRRYFPENDSLRYTANGAAFWLPSLYGVFAGRKAFTVMESSSLKKLTWVASTALVADLVYEGVQNVNGGAKAAYERWVQHRASELKAQKEGRPFLSFSGLLEFLAPEISAWWESRYPFVTEPNEYYKRVKEIDQEALRKAEKDLKEALIEQLVEGDEDQYKSKSFYETVDLDSLTSLAPLSEVEVRILNQLKLSPRQKEWAQMDLEQKASYLTHRFSGYHLSSSQAKQMLRRWKWMEIRSIAFALSERAMPGNEKLRSAFDAQGNISTLLHEKILHFLAEGDPHFIEGILEKRKAALFLETQRRRS